MASVRARRASPQRVAAGSGGAPGARADVASGWLRADPPDRRVRSVHLPLPAGVAGAAFVVLAATLSTTGTIPVASVALVLGIHRLMSEGLTPTNLIGNAVATIVVAKWEGALDEERLHKALDGSA